MDFKTTIDESADAPGTPEKIRQWLHRAIRGLMVVKVLASDDGKRPKLVNRINLQNKAGEMPDEDFEDICEAIMRIISQKYDAEHEDADVAMSFIIEGDGRDKNGNRHRPSCTYEYTPDGGPDDFTGGGIFEENPLLEIIREQRSYISDLQYHLNESHGKIVETANNNNSAMKPLMDALGHMGYYFAAGLQNQQAAMSMMYDFKKAESEERGKAERTKQWIDFLKKPAGAMAGQFMQWASSKLHNRPPPPPGAPSAPADDGPPDASEEAHTDADIEDALTEEQKENPVATFANAMANVIEPPQWFQVSELLTRKEMKTLRNVLEATTDTACVKAFDAFTELPPGKLLELHGILSEEQKQMLAQLGELVEAVKQHWE